MAWGACPMFPAGTRPLDTAGEAETGLRIAKPSLNHPGSTGTQLEAPVPLRHFCAVSWFPAVFFAPGVFPHPPQEGQLGSPPQTQHIKLEMFCETLSSFEVVSRAQKCSVSSFSKQPFSFPMTFSSGFVNIFALLYNAKQNYC